MFREIRRRLVIVNSAVLLLVLAALGAVLYLHMQYRLYHDMDEILHLSESRIRSVHQLNELLRSDLREMQQDERTTYLFWNAQGELIDQLPKQTYSQQIAQSFKPDKHLETLQTVQVQGRAYRLLQVVCGDSQCNASKPIDTISIVRSLGDVKSMLHTLLRDIGVATAIGVILSVLAGYFLAGRALVPIRRSWDRQQHFVADASHELRTPTAVIYAQTELLLRHPSHTIELESPNISIILRESKRLGRLVDDLLTLARTDSSQLQLQTSNFALDVLLQEVSGQFRFLAETKNISIDTNIQVSMPFWGDEGRIRQLLIILLDNALKFTSEPGRITIASYLTSHSVVVRIEDTGCGIAEADLPRIFERFYRGDKSRTRSIGGTGLGLSIAEWIVQAHGGKIRIHSVVNEGTRVELLLPRSR